MLNYQMDGWLESGWQGHPWRGRWCNADSSKCGNVWLVRPFGLSLLFLQFLNLSSNRCVRGFFFPPFGSRCERELMQLSRHMLFVVDKTRAISTA